MNQKERAQTNLVKTLDKIMEKQVSSDSNEYSIPIFGAKKVIVTVFRPKPKFKKGQNKVSKIGLNFGDLVKLDTAQNSDTFAVYVGEGLDPNNPNDYEKKQWFLAEGESNIHYYGNLLTAKDMAPLGIKKVGQPID